MPSHVGSYDGKGDLDNYLYLFEGAIRMQKRAMPIACYMFTYTLKDSAKICWNSQKAGSILNYEDLKAKFRSHFSRQNKFTKTHLAIHNIKQREGEITRDFVTRYTDDTLQILGLHEDQCISGVVHGLKTRNLVEFLSTDLPTTYKGLMEKTYTWIEAREVETNRAVINLRGWRHQMKEAVKSGQPDHLVNGIKKGKAKVSDTQLGKLKKGEKDKATVEAPILMISRRDHNPKKRSVKENYNEVREITFPPLSNIYSSEPVIIKSWIYGRQIRKPPHQFLDGTFLASKGSTFRDHNMRESFHKNSDSQLCHCKIQLPTQSIIGKNCYPTNGHRGIHYSHGYKIPHSQKNRHRNLNNDLNKKKRNKRS
nr:hypothetical protein [Tanacetum cinerariifolium]